MSEKKVLELNRYTKSQLNEYFRGQTDLSPNEAFYLNNTTKSKLRIDLMAGQN